MSKIEKLLEELESLSDDTKQWNKFKHIFSDDEGIQILARIRRTAGQIKFHALASKLKKTKHPEGNPIKETSLTGKFVKVRPCDDEFENKTFLGIYIGDAALGSSIQIKDDALVCSWGIFNPAILIPEKGKVVYGCGSWWGEIETEEDLKEITDNDIDNVWYVKALNQLKETKDE